MRTRDALAIFFLGSFTESMSVYLGLYRATTNAAHAIVDVLMLAITLGGIYGIGFLADRYEVRRKSR